MNALRIDMEGLILRRIVVDSQHPVATEMDIELIP